MNFGSEDDFRFKIWFQNSEYIEEHNRGNHSYKLEMNKFGAMTEDEFGDFNRFGKNGKDIPRDICTNTSIINIEHNYIPDKVDWREKGVVTPIKDQGQCGSCWAFSAVGAFESAWTLSRGTMFNLSEQQLVDCSGPEGNFGCGGGLMDFAFQYAKKYGLTTNASYPYTATDDDCQPAKPVASVARCVDFDPVGGHQNETEHLMEYIVAYQQPISVAVYAGNSFWQFYKEGIIDDPACGPNDDHGVVAVGFGVTDKGEEYWILKNSWGLDWGISGYVSLARNKNMCGIAEYPSYPII